MATKTVTWATDHFKNILTKQDVERVIEKSLGSKVDILNYHLESYTSENLGLMGAHRNLIVEVLRDSSKETHTYFLKAMPYDMKNQTKFLENSGMFRMETSFYNLIVPELMKSSKDKSWLAQCFLAKKDVLVFENLKLKNYSIRGESKFLDVPSLKAALSSLAKMHAASLLAERRLGKTFLEMYPELMYEIVFTREGPFAEWYRSGIAIATKVAENLGLNHEVVPKVCDMILEKVLPSKTRRNVISHGDTWSYNFMFNGSKCTLVDFQVMRYVPPMVDVAQAIHFNARKELRDEFEMELLECYYETFCDVLKSGGMDAPSFEHVLEEYEEMRIVGIVSISMYFPVQHMGEERMKEMMENSEGFQDMFCKDRLSFALDVMEKDERYRELITSVVRELVGAAEKLFE